MTDTNEGEKKPKAGKLDGPPKVVIFGAGITGLTAAHELVERGWEVTVVEPEIDPFNVDQCALGGMAKTQWAVYQAPDRVDSKPTEARPLVPTIRLRPGPKGEDGKPTLDEGSKIYLARFTSRLDDIAPNYPRLLITHAAEGEACEQIAESLRKLLERRVGPDKVELLEADALPPDVVQIQTDPRDKVKRDDDGGNRDPWQLQPEEMSGILPGEHGFRFFPAFYRHVFDTLRRIPVRGEGQNLGDVYRTVYDNLIATEANWLALDSTELRRDSKTAKEGGVVRFPRRLRRSLRESFDAINQMYTELGYTGRDLELIMLRLFKYMTSCQRRRNEQYEAMSWFDFMGLSDLSKPAQQDMERAPQLLAAMTARESDARTQGNIATQLLLDPINADDRVDSTLNAPTTIAWFAPWRDYLTSQGVRFIPGKLKGFWADSRAIRPEIKCDTQADEENVKGANYYVLAVPIQEWWGPSDLVKSWDRARDNLGLAEDDVGILGKWLTAHAVAKNLNKGLTGIQFYFDADQLTRSGHTLFMDSPWRLSAISQASFWNRRREPFDGYRGIVSVDIGSLKDGDKKFKSFNDTPREKIHEVVWAQMHPRAEPGAPAPYRIYHIDETIKHLPGAQPENKAPFLINGIGEWDDRPGWWQEGCDRKQRFGFEPKSGPAEDPSPARYQTMPRYQLANDATQPRWVLAGTFMQTWTRATTMEAANESARHAVNTLLEDAKARWGRHAQLCRIWNPEEYEHPDLRIWQELDEKLYEWDDEPLPHMIDILELDSLPATLLESGELSQTINALVARVGTKHHGS